MQPRFIEENFIVSCEAIRETVLRAFLAWSVNSPWISFYNVSHLCADPSDPASCEAEIRVSAVAGNANDPVSRVTLNTSDVAPLDHHRVRSSSASRRSTPSTSSSSLTRACAGTSTATTEVVVRRRSTSRR